TNGSTLRASVVINKISNNQGYSISVINPDGKNSNTWQYYVPPPVVTSASEDSVNHYLSSNGSGGYYDLVLTGTNFQAWPGISTATVSIYRGGVPSSDITVTSTTYISATTLRASI